MLAKDLDLELLRAFVAVVDGGGFTRAAQRLHRTQSTVSQQIKRLEARLDAPLLERNTRGFALTERGDLLLAYARRLLALNDEALAAVAQTRLSGKLRIGAAQEVADGGLADMLAHFSRLHPGIRLQVRVAANQRLVEAVERGELDLAVAFREPSREGAADETVMARMRRVWVAAPSLRLLKGEAVPLVLYEPPCLFRDAALKALEAAGLPWRVALTTPSLSGIRAAVRAGLGVAVRTERWLEPDQGRLRDELPALPDVELALLCAETAEPTLAERLRTALRESLAGNAASRAVGKPPMGSPGRFAYPAH